jgi:hypothetical protein
LSLNVLHARSYKSCFVFGNTNWSDFKQVIRFLDSLTVSIRIVADCVLLSCQTEMKLKRATSLELTTDPAIIFIYCYGQFLIYHPKATI